jgi:nicotinamidase-related amidase
MDFQEGVVARLENAGVLVAARRAIEAAHDRDIKVIFVRVAFRDGYPEISPANQTFAAIAAGHVDFRETSPATQLHSSLTAAPGDVTVIKRRVSAFTGSDLDLVLSAGGTDTLVLAGIATSGVVLSTLREAADRDFRIVVLKDACADQDAEVHAVLMDKVFPRQAQVCSVDNWIATLTADS